jgi:spermidine synthase
MNDLYSGIVIPKEVYTASTEYNKDITITHKGDLYKLYVEGILASVSPDSLMAKRMYWGNSVDIVKELAPNFSSALCLGLGGGTFQSLLCNEFPKSNVTSIEIDMEMITIAYQYFKAASSKNHVIINEDALRFVIEHEHYDLEDHSFDLCHVDIFQGEVFPDLATSGNFLSNLNMLLMPNSLVLFNRIYLKHHQESVDNFIELLEQHLTDISTKVIAGKTNSDHILIYGYSR